jgi:DNA invertase Pin-like site-specific DNA recombinase
LRVSTDKQGRSGLGVEAQREAVTRHLNGGSWKLVAEYVETESGKRSDRPKLAAALGHAKAIGATVVFAKLDRLTITFIAHYCGFSEASSLSRAFRIAYQTSPRRYRQTNQADGVDCHPRQGTTIAKFDD